MAVTSDRNNSSLWSKVLSAILVMAILGALGMLVYSIASPVRKPFTEFYLLNSDRKATDYPTLLALGEEGKVIVGIINRELETTTYRMEVRIEGITNNEVGPITLANDDKWEEIVPFTPDRVGDEQKVEFLLYKQGGNEAYQRLHLFVDVQ